MHSHKPCNRLPLLICRPAVIIPDAEPNYTCLVTHLPEWNFCKYQFTQLTSRSSFFFRELRDSSSLSILSTWNVSRSMLFCNTITSANHSETHSISPGAAVAHLFKFCQSNTGNITSTADCMSPKIREALMTARQNRLMQHMLGCNYRWQTKYYIIQ